MINHFDDFCLWAYVVVDDMRPEQEAARELRRPKDRGSPSVAPVTFFIRGCLHFSSRSGKGET